MKFNYNGHYETFGYKTVRKTTNPYHNKHKPKPKAITLADFITDKTFADKPMTLIINNNK